MKKLFFIAALLLFAAGCQAQSLYVDMSLVGTWHWTQNVGWTYVFNADGTGQRGDAEVHRFTWGTVDGLLVLDHGAGFVNDEMTFGISGNMLQLEGEFGTFTYFRFVPDTQLAGNWVHTGYLVEKRINPDGTGVHVTFPDSGNRHFNWFSVADMFIHQMDGQQDEWTYTVAGNWLVLESRNQADVTQEWQRGSFVERELLVGEWYWSENDAYRIVFSEGSFARQNLDGVIVPLYWTTFQDTLILVNLQTSTVEHWRFDISTGDLFMDSLTREDARYMYRRVAD